ALGLRFGRGLTLLHQHDPESRDRRPGLPHRYHAFDRTPLLELDLERAAVDLPSLDPLVRIAPHGQGHLVRAGSQTSEPEGSVGLAGGAPPLRASAAEV